MFSINFLNNIATKKIDVDYALTLAMQYISLMKLVSYEIDVKNAQIRLFTHAPIDFGTFVQQVKDTANISIDITSVAGFIKSIDALNLWFTTSALSK